MNFYAEMGQRLVIMDQNIIGRAIRFRDNHNNAIIKDIGKIIKKNYKIEEEEFNKVKKTAAEPHLKFDHQKYIIENAGPTCEEEE